jgi:predicted nucleic acid-binding Zn finger protein
MESEQQRLMVKFPELAKHGAKLRRAAETVLAGGVKESVFHPSGRKLVTVVGRLGDEFVDPEKPYCSCSNFYFKVLGGREEACYHLLSYWMASKTGRVDVIEFDDEEYPSYLAATLGDVFDVLGKKGG